MQIQVCFFDPYLLSGVERALDIKRVRTLEEALSTGDIISLHCTSTPETHHITNEHALSLVQPSAMLITPSSRPSKKVDSAQRDSMSLRSNRHGPRSPSSSPTSHKRRSTICG